MALVNSANEVAALAKGDALELLPEINSETIDLIVTDPPYGKAIKMNRRKHKDKLCEVIAGDNDLETVRQAIPQLFRVLKPNTAMFMFMSPTTMAQVEPWLVGAGFKIKNHIVWDKVAHGVGDLKGSFSSQWECLFLAVKGRPLLRGHRFSDIWRYPRIASQKMLHMNQKPVELLKRCIAEFSDEAGIVLDPFMGSGSTGVAALELNRQFIGIELDSQYYNVANERIGQHSGIIKV